MARPTKQGVDYFPLDVQFDDKIELLIAECGPCSVSVLITIWQLIYQNEGYYIRNSHDLLLLIKRRILMEPDDSKPIVEAAIRRNVFSESMANEHGILTSRAIQKRYFLASKKKKTVTVNKNYILDGVYSGENSTSIDVVSCGNATKVNVKEKEKEKEEVKEKEKEDEEGNGEVSKKKPSPKPTRLVDQEFLELIFQNPAYADLDIRKELGKCEAWCLVNSIATPPSRKRFVTWLNRAYGKPGNRVAVNGVSKMERNRDSALRVLEGLQDD